MNRLAKSMLVSLVAATVAGCSSSSSRMGGAGGVSAADPRLDAQGGPAASEIPELCELQRRMVGETQEQQLAMLEAHMQAAHGSVNPQSLAMHRRAMGRCPAR